MNLLQTLKLLALAGLALPALAQTTVQFQSQPLNLNTGGGGGGGTPQMTVVIDTKTGKEVQLDLSKLNAQAPNLGNIVVSTATSTKIGPQGKGKTACGGIVNGKPQPPCALLPGTYESQAVGNCPDGSFFDGMTWACWSCPPGHQRTGYPVDGTAACSIADSSMKGELMSAKYAGPLCAPGTFHDPIRGGECYKCPPGHQRSGAHIDASNACYVPGGEKFSFAELSFRTGDARHCVNRADGADRGQLVFWDMYNFNGQGPGCWKCPVGFQRSGHPVYSDRACSAYVPEQQARATVVRKAECGPGEIHDIKIPGQQDPATGGGCYSCPEGTVRTAHDVTGGWACGKDVGVRLTKATRAAGLTCPGDQHFDFISSKHPQVQALVRQQFSGKPLPKDFGTSDGGTCWSCPPGTKRTTRAVYEAGACEAQLIKWQAAPYGQPGLFGLDGGEEVAQAIVRDRRDMIDELALDMLGNKMGKTEARRMVWEEIATTPHTSGVLAVAVLSRVQAALKEPGKATDAERRLAASFAQAARDFRIFIAQNALDAYDAWSEAETYHRLERAKQPTLNVLFDYGAVPPDFYEVAGGAILGTTALGGAMSTAIGLGLKSSAVHAKLFPFAKVAEQRFIQKTTSRLAEKMGQKMAEQMALKSAKALATVIKAIGTLGPQIIITLAIEAIQYTTEQIVAIADARPRLLTRLATAQQPIDMARLLDTVAGVAELENMWSLAMGSEIATKHLDVFKQAAAEAMKQGGATNTWTQLQGQAIDVGASANALWVIGTNPVPGGFGLHRWDGKSFVPASGGAVRIDLDPNGNPWVVNDGGKVFRWSGSSWVGLPGENGQDIGVGANGAAWLIGGAKVPGGFGIHRWQNNTWVTVPGGAVRIDVDPQGNAWVVNDAGNIFRWTGSTFAQVPGKARDVGVGPDGSVFVVGDNGTVHKWDGKTWIMRDGLLNEISVGPNGIPVGVNASKQIWMGYP